MRSMGRWAAAFIVIAGLGVAGDLEARQSASPKRCARSDKGEYSVGGLVMENGQRYRCSETFDSALKSSGVAWVKVDQDGKAQDR